MALCARVNWHKRFNLASTTSRAIADNESHHLRNESLGSLRLEQLSLNQHTQVMAGFISTQISRRATTTTTIKWSNSHAN